MMQPTIQTLVHKSKLLEKNPLGDPSERALPVYLPPNYDAKRKDPYPVMYILAGWSGRGARYLNDDGVFSAPLPESFDRMIQKEESPPFIVVFPDCSTKLGASQYVNSTSTGPYMDYLCDELIPFVDSKFHTYGDAVHRGVLGHSSGGFGAMVTTMMRPGSFSYLCSSAGDSWYDFIYKASIPTMIRIIKNAGGVEKFLQKFLSSPNPTGLLSKDDCETMMNLSMCACYAPNPNVPILKGDVYFDLETGETIPSVWEKFLAWDPVHMVDRYVDNLKKLRWIHFEAGTEDEYALHIGHRQVAKKLDKHGIKYVLEEYPGKHGGHHYRMAYRIKRILEAMKASC